MAISPLKNNEFVTTGKYNVTIWKAVAGNMEKFSVIETNSTITCCIYRLVEEPEHYLFGHYKSDNPKFSEEIIVGS
jgi:hypothetical protein